MYCVDMFPKNHVTGGLGGGRSASPQSRMTLFVFTGNSTGNDKYMYANIYIYMYCIYLHIYVYAYLYSYLQCYM